MPNVTNHTKSSRRITRISSASRPIKPIENTEKECNCRQKECCPLPSKCLVESVVYQATVTREDNQQRETYTSDTQRVHLKHDTTTTQARSGTRNTNMQPN